MNTRIMISKCSDEYRENFFASEFLWEEAKKKFGGQMVAAFAYTNYGGTIVDKLMIRWYLENYPDNIVWEKSLFNGENAICVDVPEFQVKDLNNIDVFYDGPCIEDLFYKLQEEEIKKETLLLLQEEKVPFSFAGEIFDWLCDNSSLYTFGIDYDLNDLDKFITLLQRKLITA